jgi:hypothetical protein
MSQYVTLLETTTTVSGTAAAKCYVAGMTGVGLDSAFSVLPEKVTVKGNPVEIVESVTDDKQKRKLY